MFIALRIPLSGRNYYRIKSRLCPWYLQMTRNFYNPLIHVSRRFGSAVVGKRWFFFFFHCPSGLWNQASYINDDNFLPVVVGGLLRWMLKIKNERDPWSSCNIIHLTKFVINSWEDRAVYWGWKNWPRFAERTFACMVLWNLGKGRFEWCY